MITALNLMSADWFTGEALRPRPVLENLPVHAPIIRMDAQFQRSNGEEVGRVHGPFPPLHLQGLGEIPPFLIRVLPTAPLGQFAKV